LGKRYNILICPLEWGLGHATRMIPLAKKLRDLDHNVIIGSGKEYHSLFRNELPGLSYIVFSGFKPTYSRYLPQYLYLLLKTPLLLYQIIREHNTLKKIIEEHKIDIVISDNRFGLWNKKITSVYVTHMPLIPLPGYLRFLEIIGVKIHREIIKRYSLCFIPDLPGGLNISGRLSHGIKLPENVRFTGILSRFQTSGSHSVDIHKSHYNTVILSGPEPQRGILRKKLISILKEKTIQGVIFEGRADKSPEVIQDANISCYSHLPANEMEEIIKGSDTIITRSGYTTIMDLISLNCSALLIPTPGQTEQEYLAEYLSGMGWFSTLPQGKLKNGIKFPLKKTIPQCEIIEKSNLLLSTALQELLNEPHKKA
jgi:spore coat polysaccharide biosynthesis predicted glycosyltransferase SpsG